MPRRNAPAMPGDTKSDVMAPARLVAFLDSPLQALNLVEYCERFSHQVDVVVIGDRPELAPSNRAQIEAVLSHVNPRQVIYQEWALWPKQPHRSRRALKSGVATLRASLSSGPYEFVVGEFRSDFSWALLHRLKRQIQSLVVLDDGTAMLRIDRRKSAWRSREQWRQTIRRLAFLANGIRGTAAPARLTFFTAYALEGQIAASDAVVRNDYRTLSAELRSLPPDEDSVYVIGSPHREAGAVDQGDVELALDLARFAAELTGREVVYVAHRRERAEKLEALRNEFSVVCPDVPFEIYPRVLGKRPCMVVGYASSLFATLTELLGNSIEITALRIPRESLNGTWLSFFDDLYDYYRVELSEVRVVDRSTLPPDTRS